jgi:outer membrane autotransporter protein
MGQKSYPCRRGAGMRRELLSSTSWILWRGARTMAVLVPALVWYCGLDAKPAHAQSGPSTPKNVPFCSAQDGEGACQGPTTSPGSDISSSAQRQIEQRLEQIRCENRLDPACITQGGASEDATASLNGFSWFVSGEYQHKDRDQTPFELGFDQNTVGGTAGIDYRIGTSGVIGGAFNYRHAFGQYKRDYGDFHTDSENFILYGSYFPTDQSFIDLSVGLAPKQFSDTHADTVGLSGSEVSGNTDGFEFTSDVSGGYDFSFDAFSVGPRLGFHYKHTRLDGFTETSPDPAAVTDRYLSQTNDSITSTVGAQASYAISTNFGVVVPQVNAEYVHEFAARERNQAVPGAGFGGIVSFADDKPDRNYFNVGAGVVFVLPDGVSPFLNFQAEVGNSLEETQTVTAGVRIEM